MIIIATAGSKQSGKSTLCTYLKSVLAVRYGDCRIYAWADSLKKFCIDILGLSNEQCYGEEEQKNIPTRYSWDRMPLEVRMQNSLDKVNPRSGIMTARNIMQVAGTDIIRNLFSDDIWINATLKHIETDQPDVALISDTRFKVEIDSLLKYPRSYIIKLNRKPFEDIHKGEKDLDDYNFSNLKWLNRHIIINNMNMDIHEKEKEVLKFLKEKSLL